MKRFFLPVIASVLFLPTHAKELQLMGAGATFPQPVYNKWAAQYQQEKGHQISYQGVGSSAGVKQIEAQTVDFGASDVPLSDEELSKKRLIQFPTLLGGIVPVVNISGVKADELVLSGEVLAKIYLGEIKQWNDPAISALNPSLKLPEQNIATVFRSDGSGTSHNFTTYLSAVSPTWKEKVGANKSPSWPTAGSTGVAAKGNDGIAALVKKLDYSIGYVEYSYAKESALAYTKLVNRAGEAVTPSVASFQAATKIDNPKQIDNLINQSEAKDAWPLVSATFILLSEKPRSPEHNQAVKDFFSWTREKGDNIAQDLGYAPLSSEIKQNIQEQLK